MLNTKKKPIFGLTGGIASGKSTVTKMFEALGVTVVDADILARTVVAKGSTGLDEIRKTFGEDVLLPDGSLDREKMGKLVFSNTDARAKLNSIVHPKIRELSGIHIEAAVKGPTPYVIYSAALIVENHLEKDFQGLIVVSASPKHQAERLCRREGLTEVEAELRIASQFPLSEKIKRAHYIINNDNTLEQTKLEVQAVHRKILQRENNPG